MTEVWRRPNFDKRSTLRRWRKDQRFKFTPSQIQRIERREERERKARQLREAEKLKVRNKKRRQEREAKAREERRRFGLPDPAVPKVSSSQQLISKFLGKASKHSSLERSSIGIEDGKTDDGYGLVSDTNCEPDTGIANSHFGDSESNGDSDADSNAFLSLALAQDSETVDHGVTSGGVELIHLSKGLTSVYVNESDRSRNSYDAYKNDNNSPSTHDDWSISDEDSEIERELADMNSVSNSPSKTIVGGAGYRAQDTVSEEILFKDDLYTASEESPTQPASVQESAEDVLAIVSTQVLEDIEFDDKENWRPSRINSMFLTSGSPPQISEQSPPHQNEVERLGIDFPGSPPSIPEQGRAHHATKLTSPVTIPRVDIEVLAPEPASENPGSVGESFSSFDLSETDFLEMGLA